jgi:omega-6 fatty acid desaturase (delta-12 desaturase)
MANAPPVGYLSKDDHNAQLTTSTVDAGGTPAAKSTTDWRKVVEPYAQADARRSTLQLVTTFGALALNMWLIALALDASVWLALPLTLPAAGLLVRVFIFMHDCTHSSFYANRTANETVGFITGAITLTPFAQWRRDHALHHASSGDLDRRGNGDIPTWTVKEYLAKTPKQRLFYRIVRHPVLMLLGGPVWLATNQRFRGKSMATKDKQQSSVMWTNVAIVAGLAIAILTVGFKTVLFAYLIPFYIAAAAGIWLFYVQHQFEDAYWTQKPEWDYVEASLRGSSHLKMPAILNWFTGDIGLHHVHHVAPKIPNHRLRECHNENELFHQSPVVTIKSGVAALRLALWDEDNQRLISFRDLRNRQTV